jgi:hypothetical protein
MAGTDALGIADQEPIDGRDEMVPNDLGGPPCTKWAPFDMQPAYFRVRFAGR